MNRLKVLVNWLKTYKVIYDERDGVLERAIKGRYYVPNW